MTYKKFQRFMLMNDKEFRAATAQLDPDDLVSLQEMMNQAQADLDEPAKKAPSSTPAAAAVAAPVPTPAPKPKLGMGKDGIFRLTDEQARDPEFSYRTQKERVRAAGIEIVK